MRAKELEATASRQAPSKLARTSANKYPNLSLFPEDKYCAICTPLGKLCHRKFPGSQDWEDSKEDKGNDQGKGEDNFSESQTQMQISRNKKEKKQRNKKQKGQ